MNVENTVYKKIQEMIEFINQNEVIYFCDFVDYAMENKVEWFISLCDDSGLIISSYINSKRQKKDVE